MNGKKVDEETETGAESERIFALSYPPRLFLSAEWR